MYQEMITFYLINYSKEYAILNTLRISKIFQMKVNKLFYTIYKQVMAVII
jgi:hypothetical protein